MSFGSFFLVTDNDTDNEAALTQTCNAEIYQLIVKNSQCCNGSTLQRENASFTLAGWKAALSSASAKCNDIYPASPACGFARTKHPRRAPAAVTT